MSDPDPKPKSRYDDLPKMRTPSGRYVYDPDQAPEPKVDRPKLREMLEEMRRIENADAREAPPEAVEAARGEDGAIVVAGDDAAKAHAAVVVETHAAPRMPSAAVRIADVMDPRKVTTARMAKPAAAPESVWASEAAPAIDKDALPSSTAPSASPPPNVETSQPATKTDGKRPDRRWFAGGVILVGLAATAVLVFRGSTSGSPAEIPGTGTATTATTEPAPPPASAARSSSASEVEVMGTSTGNPTAAPAATVAPSTTGAAPTAPSSSPAPKSSAPPGKSADPYPDAGAAPKPTATSEPITAPAASSTPSAAPAASAPSSSVPATSAAPATTGTNFLFRPKGDTDP